MSQLIFEVSSGLYVKPTAPALASPAPTVKKATFKKALQSPRAAGCRRQIFSTASSMASPQACGTKRGGAAIEEEVPNIKGLGPADARRELIKPPKRDHAKKARVDDSSRARQADGVQLREKPRILAFFVQPRADRLNTKGESQNLSLSVLSPHYFEFDQQVQPCFEHFQTSLMYSAVRNVRIVHLAGHADHEGFYFALDDHGLQTEPIKPENITELLVQQSDARGGKVECVVFNACCTEAMGRQLRAEGMTHVVCWRGEVRDGAALEFSKAFYKSLQVSAGAGCTSIPPGAYKAAFKQGCVALRVWKGGCSADRGRKGVEMVRSAKKAPIKAHVVLMLSEDGDEETRCCEH